MKLRIVDISNSDLIDSVMYFEYIMNITGVSGRRRRNRGACNAGSGRKAEKREIFGIPNDTLPVKGDLYMNFYLQNLSLLHLSKFFGLLNIGRTPRIILRINNKLINFA